MPPSPCGPGGEPGLGEGIRVLVVGRVGRRPILAEGVVAPRLAGVAGIAAIDALEVGVPFLQRHGFEVVELADIALVIDAVGVGGDAHVLDHVEHDAGDEVGLLLVACVVGGPGVLPPAFDIVGAGIGALVLDALLVEVEAVERARDGQLVQFLVGAFDDGVAVLAEFGEFGGELVDGEFGEVAVGGMDDRGQPFELGAVPRNSRMGEARDANGKHSGYNQPARIVHLKFPRDAGRGR